MPQDAVQLVRECVAALNAYLADPTDIGPYLAFLAPDFEYRPQGGPEDRRTYGRAEIEGYVARYLDEFDGLEWIEEEMVPAGGRVFCAFRLAGVAKRSGLEVSMRVFEVYTVRDGRIKTATEFRTRAEAQRCFDGPAA